MKKLIILFFTVAFILAGLWGVEKKMWDKKTNLEVVKLIVDMYNNDSELANYIFDDDCRHHINGSIEKERGPEVVKKSISLISEQFSKSKTTFIEIISNMENIAVRWKWEAINKITHKKWQFNGNTIFHFKNSKIIEYWAIDDRYREMQDHGFTIIPPHSK